MTNRQPATKSPLRRGLYAITDHQEKGIAQLKHDVSVALTHGITLLQYRDKSRDALKRKGEVSLLVNLCNQHNVPLIINDDVELAATVGAQGVHLGKDDQALDRARASLGDNAIIGVSCYNDLSIAKNAEQKGADYVAFGRFFPSSSKPNAVHADPELLMHAKGELSIPIVAIGGITPENGHQLINAGADMLAVIHGIFGQGEISNACSRFSTLFSHSESTQ